VTGRIALIGAPTDVNSSFMRGPAKAPPVIRAMLHSDKGNSSTEIGGALGDEIDLVDLGDLALDETSADDARIEGAIHSIVAAGDIPLVLGGDHSITYPVVKAISAKLGKLNILHIDAHPDLYDELGGNRRSHATPFARIMEGGHCDWLAQVGIRTMNPHQLDQAELFDVEVIPMRGFTPGDVPELTGPLYISIDVDGLDPSVAPGVSHHEPGGLTMREVMEVLVRQTAPIVGMDIVEFNPDRDVMEMTASVAAKLVKEVAALATRNRRSA
jgi:arginase